jgi:hypothetical protein
MKHWHKHYSDMLPRLSEEDWPVVEHLTGRVPLLLSALFSLKDQEFTEQALLSSPQMNKVFADVLEFVNTTRQFNDEDKRWCAFFRFQSLQRQFYLIFT